MAIKWIRNKLPPTNDATERGAFYNTKLQQAGWLTSYETNAGTTYDYLYLQPVETTGCLCRIKVNGSGGSWTDANISITEVYQSTNGPSGSPNTISNVVGTDVNGLYFDTAKIGGIDVLRITNLTPTTRCLILAKSNAAKADGGTGMIYYMSAPYFQSSVYDQVGIYSFMNDFSVLAKSNYSGSTSAGASIQLVTTNKGSCNNPILNRYAVLGMATNFYTYDGTQNGAPAHNVEFNLSVNGVVTPFYSLGHGLCIRE